MFGLAYPLLFPLISKLDAETAHSLAIAALETVPLPSRSADDPRLNVDVMGQRFSNPLGIAAGFDKDARAPEALNRLGFGFVEVGGVTRLPQPGNPRPRVFRLVPDQAVINRYGLNSAGMDAVAARLAKLDSRRFPLGINLGANKETDDRIGDYGALVARLAPLADFLTLNVSSPNTPGLRDLQGRAFLDELIARVLETRAKTGSSVKILVKIAPDLDDIQLDDIVDVARNRGIDGMIVANTTIARPASLIDRVNARETGGLSGKPLFRASTIMLAKTYLRVEKAFPLVGVGGIASGEDAVAKMSAGASLIQLYSALIFRGPGLISEIKSSIVKAVSREGVANAAALTGANASNWANESA